MVFTSSSAGGEAPDTNLTHVPHQSSGEEAGERALDRLLLRELLTTLQEQRGVIADLRKQLRQRN